jgi:hypothetical protein
MPVVCSVGLQSIQKEAIINKYAYINVVSYRELYVKFVFFSFIVSNLSNFVDL